MKIKVLGTVEKNPGIIDSLLDAMKKLKINPELEISSNMSDFIKYKVRSPGAIIINDKVVFKGHHDLSGNIMKALKKAAEKEKLASGEVEIIDGKVVDHSKDVKGKGFNKKVGK